MIDRRASRLWLGRVGGGARILCGIGGRPLSSTELAGEDAIEFGTARSPPPPHRPARRRIVAGHLASLASGSEHAKTAKLTENGYDKSKQ